MSTLQEAARAIVAQAPERYGYGAAGNVLDDAKREALRVAAWHDDGAVVLDYQTARDVVRALAESGAPDAGLLAERIRERLNR